jgi:hypothetical protein
MSSPLADHPRTKMFAKRGDMIVHEQEPFNAETGLAALAESSPRCRSPKHALALQAERAYRRTIADWKGHRSHAKRSGRERDTGARIFKALEGQSRAASPCRTGSPPRRRTATNWPERETTVAACRLP